MSARRLGETGRARQRVHSVAIVGDAVILRGFAAHVIAHALAEHISGGVDGLAAKMRLGPNGHALLRQTYEHIEEVGDAWWSAHQARATATAADGNGERQPGSAEASSERWLSTNEAAALLGVKARRVRQLAEEGALAGHRGKRWLFRRQDVLSLRELRDRQAA